MIKLRQVTQDDRILDLDIRADQYKFGVNPKRILGDAFALDNKNRTNIFAIYNDELPVGMVEYCDEDDLLCYNILYLFIDQRYQGKGYGLATMRLIIDMLKKDKKYNKVSVTLYIGNETARNLYEKIGFSPNGYLFEDEYDMEMIF